MRFNIHSEKNSKKPSNGDDGKADGNPSCGRASPVGPKLPLTAYLEMPETGREWSACVGPEVSPGCSKPIEPDLSRSVRHDALHGEARAIFLSSSMNALVRTPVGFWFKSTVCTTTSRFEGTTAIICPP